MKNRYSSRSSCTCMDLATCAIPRPCARGLPHASVRVSCAVPMGTSRPVALVVFVSLSLSLSLSLFVYLSLFVSLGLMVTDVAALLTHAEAYCTATTKAASKQVAEWTEGEERRLLTALDMYGEGNWMRVADFVGGNKDNTRCRTRWQVRRRCCGMGC